MVTISHRQAPLPSFFSSTCCSNNLKPDSMLVKDNYPVNPILDIVLLRLHIRGMVLVWFFWLYFYVCVCVCACVCVCVRVFLGLHLRHMELPRLGVQWELQPPAYTIAIATQDLSRPCDLPQLTATPDP